MKNASKIMEELEKTIEEGEEEVVEVTGKEIGEPVEEPVVEDIVEEGQEEPVSEEPEEDLETDATSDDVKKRGAAFASMRAEIKESREKAEAAEKARQEMAEKIARLEGKMEGVTPKATTEDVEPDSMLYPEDHNAWKIKQLEKRTEAAEKVAQQSQAYQNYQNEMRGVEILEKQFKTSNPKEDYEGSVEFLMERERKAKRIMNPAMTDVQVDAQIEQEKLQLFRMLASQGRNPAEVLVKLAKEQGFASKAPAPKTDLRKLEDNQRRASNLIGGSPAGKTNGNKPTSEDILGMSFNKILAQSKKNPNFFGDVE